ncbi:unnamed protein product [marine sediment metagenome]|uniref:Uncharacterized protein n=1 Tax=marine sediment metagenome TaxID=412755 RepID=X1PTL6_9ZZZZ
MKHMIQPVINPGMLQSQNILWLLNDANLTRVALVTATDEAGVGLGNIKTNGA